LAQAASLAARFPPASSFAVAAKINDEDFLIEIEHFFTSTGEDIALAYFIMNWYGGHSIQ